MNLPSIPSLVFASEELETRRQESIRTRDYSKQGINYGHRYPHLSSGLKIAKEFDVCLDWLYTGVT